MGDPGSLGKAKGSTQTPSSNLNWSNAKINELSKVRSFSTFTGSICRCTSHGQRAHRPRCAQRWQLVMPDGRPEPPAREGTHRERVQAQLPRTRGSGTPAQRRTPPALLSQIKEGRWALRREGEERPAGFSRSTGPSPTPNFPEFSSGLAPLPRAPRPPRPPLARARSSSSGAAREPERRRRRWRAWSLQPRPSPPGLGLRAEPPPGPRRFQRQARARRLQIPSLAGWHPLPLPSSPRRSSASGPGAAPTPRPGPCGRAGQRRHSPGSRSRGLARSRRW